MIGLRNTHGKIDSHLSILRKLASETAIYGVSSIVGRFLNYLLVPLYTYHFSPAEYGVVSELYAYAGFFAVVLVFDLETGYFRFRAKDDTRPGDLVFATALRFVLAANAVFLLAKCRAGEMYARCVRRTVKRRAWLISPRSTTSS